MTANGKPLVLIVEDETDLVTLLRYNLEKEGFRVTAAADGEEALLIASEQPPNLVLLDWMLPLMSGIEVCRQLRRGPRTREVPIIMLTARGEEADRVRGLNSGADDYVAKPFSPTELLARIRAVLRRHGGGSAANGQLMRFGSMEIDRDARTVTIAGKPCELTSYQFDLLVALAERAGRVLTRDQIMEAVRGRELDAFDRSIDVHMGRIRAAIELDAKAPKRILTVRGVGYVFARQQD
jgi:DNA-binding response OmpR family regulator